MRKRASITVFSALAFALVASFLMALLEAGRVYQIQTYADMKSTLALESVCAEYQPMLWEEFHLLPLRELPEIRMHCIRPFSVFLHSPQYPRP